MALVRNDGAATPGSPLSKIFLYFFIVAASRGAACLHLNSRTKVGIMYSIESDAFFYRSLYFWAKIKVWTLIESNNFFLESAIFLGQKKVVTLKSAPFFFLAPDPAHFVRPSLITKMFIFKLIPAICFK